MYKKSIGITNNWKSKLSNLNLKVVLEIKYLHQLRWGIVMQYHLKIKIISFIN